MRALQFILIMFAFLSVQSQEIWTSVRLDTSKIRIGEQAKIDLFINYKPDKNFDIQWPSLSDTLRKEVEIISASKIDTTIPGKSGGEYVQLHQCITITSFDSGYWAIQPFQFIINNDTTHKLETGALLLEVQTLPVDTAITSLRDIKAPFKEDFDWKVYLPEIYLACGIVLAILIFILLYKKLRKKEEKPIIKIIPGEAPHITAFRALQELQQKNLWQQGKTKEYFTYLTDILRLYLEGRFGIQAMELTSEEIIVVFRSQIATAECKDKLKQILQLSDLVKFAKMETLQPENELAWQNAYDFIEGTLREDSKQSNAM
jgi:hypothetical protein